MKVCPIFHNACLGTFREHAVHYKGLYDIKYMHNFISDVLFDIFNRAEVHVKKEALVNFLFDPIDGRSTLRSPDVMAYRWVQWRSHPVVRECTFQSSNLIFFPHISLLFLHLEPPHFFLHQLTKNPNNFLFIHLHMLTSL